jgi:prophage antirepressor-like protein
MITSNNVVNTPTAFPRNPPASFVFKDNTIRTIVDDSGNPWFVAADVCDALEIKNSRQALKKLDDDEKGVISSDTLGGAQSLATVNEAGLYELIFRSRKPEAKEFKRWIKRNVLPALRMDGMYIEDEENLLSGCTSPADVKAQLVAARAQAVEMLDAKLARLEHQDEKDARGRALKSLSKDRSGRRRRKYPPTRVIDFP